MLSVPSHHRVEMSAESSVCVIRTKTSKQWAFGSVYGLLHLIRHLQPCYGLHLWIHKEIQLSMDVDNR